MSSPNKKVSFKEKVAKSGMYVLSHISPTLSSKVLYRILTHKKLNLKNPTLFNEKLMKLKIDDYNNNDLVIKCTDKYKVREYVEECGASEILNEYMAFMRMLVKLSGTNFLINLCLNVTMDADTI